MSYLDEVNSENIVNVVKGIQNAIRSLQLREVSCNQLSEISSDMGDQRLGRVIALSSGIEPTDKDACGSFVSTNGEEFAGTLVHIGGVNNGDLEFGLSSTDGKGVLGGGAVTIGRDGIVSTDIVKTILEAAAVDSGSVYRTGSIGMEFPEGAVDPAWEISMHDEGGANAVTNGDAESGDLTGWTATTESHCIWEASLDFPRSGNYCFKITRTDEFSPSGVLTSNRYSVSGSGYLLVSGFTKADRYAQSIIEVIWYNHATAGSELRTDIVLMSKAMSYVGNEVALKPPAGALSYEIVLVAHTREARFDDISAKWCLLSEKFQLTGTGLKSTHGIYPQKATIWADEVITDVIVVRDYYDSRFPYSTYTYAVTSNSNNGDEYSYYFSLEVGIYKLYILGVKTAASGKLDYYLDGVLIDSANDWYGSSTTFTDSVSSINVSYSGSHLLMIKVNGKNVSSSDYCVFLTKLWFVKED